MTKQLRLPSHFVLDLLHEDDWSFIVKAHALTEAAVTAAVRYRLGNLSIEEFWRWLATKGRLDLAEEIEAIDGQLLVRIRAICRMRNDIVHDVTKCSFCFAEYLSDRDCRNAFQGLFLQGVTGSEDIAGHQVDRKQLLTENPKLAVVMFLIELMANVYLQQSAALLKPTLLKLGESLLNMLSQKRTTES